MKPRATRSADIVASVPEETSRIFSIDGIMKRTSSPNSTSRAVGAPNVVPDGGGVDDGRHHVGIGVAEDQRPPRADEVEVAVAVDVEDVRRRRRAR